MRRSKAQILAVVMTFTAIASLSGCAQVRGIWPWHAKAAAAPTPVHELNVVVPPDVATPIVLQYWERNTLVVDLRDVPSSGRVTLQRREGQTWPVRIAFRATPGRFETLEVRGAERALFPIAADRSAPVTVNLQPSAYGATTAALTVSWGPSSAF
ncbi:MAG: hypothetical protein ABI859_11550 [Pseudomonadota bacterium]